MHHSNSKSSQFEYYGCVLDWALGPNLVKRHGNLWFEIVNAQ